MNEFALSDVLCRVSFDDLNETAEIRNQLECSHKTALNKLHKLNSAGILSKSKVGNAYLWSLSDEPFSPIKSGELVPDDIPELLSEVFIQASEQLEQSNDDIPPEIEQWVSDRGVPDSLSTAEYALRIAVFRRYLRSILYSLHQPEHPLLEPLVSIEDWEQAFQRAVEQTGAAGFESSVVDQLIPQKTDTIDDLLLALRHPIAHVDEPAALFSEVYETLTPQAARRDLGQFATPSFVSTFMASWAVQKEDDTIMDPGIGAGPLASHALSKKIELGATNPLADIAGIDIDEVAIAMASVSLKLVDGVGKSNLIHSDFIQHSHRSFKQEGIQTESYDAVIANPPYSRHQALDSQMKEDLEQIISRESTYDFSQRTPLYGYFLVHAAQFLRSGGRIAAIVPSKFLDTEFGRDLKRYLLEEFTIHGIVQFGDEVDVFEGVRTRPSVLLLEKGTAPGSHQTRFIRVSSWSGDLDAETLLDTDPEEITGVSGSTTIAQSLLSPAERWSYYLDETDVRDFPELTEFDEIATPHRGIATGDNDYFCLTQDVVEEYDIPERYRVKIIRSAHGLDLVNLIEENWESWRDDGESVWLLYCFDSDGVIEKKEIESSGLLRYLSEGENSETADRYIVSNRSTWYRVEPQEPAPILGKYMNRTGFLFMRNDAELRTLNNIHAIYLDFDENNGEYEMYRDVLLAYLNSTVMERVLSKESHNYSGLQKLEISQLNGAPVLDPREIDPQKRMRLANLFNDLRRSRQSGNDGNTFIEQIDQELKPLLELDEQKST